MQTHAYPAIRHMVRGAYDVQQLRIECGNRICANFRTKLGIQPCEKDEEDKVEKALSAAIREAMGAAAPPPKKTETALSLLLFDFQRITDDIIEVSRRRKYDYDGVISDYTELCLIAQYRQLLAQEQRHFRDIAAALEQVPIYTQWLKQVKGVGPAMAGVIVSEIDITTKRYCSTLWKYCGLDVAKDGRGRSRRAEHLVDREYVDKNGEVKTRKSITFHPKLKTKLVGVLGGSFLRSGSPYADLYYQYRHRIENMERHQDKTDGHIHRMSVRYMVKIFLKDLWKVWRGLEGLPVPDPYHAAKLEKRVHPLLVEPVDAEPGRKAA